MVTSWGPGGGGGEERCIQSSLQIFLIGHHFQEKTPIVSGSSAFPWDVPFKFSLLDIVFKRKLQLFQAA